MDSKTALDKNEWIQIKKSGCGCAEKEAHLHKKKKSLEEIKNNSFYLIHHTFKKENKGWASNSIWHG